MSTEVATPVQVSSESTAAPALVALVTGSASGIGRATAGLLASKGFKVVIADIDAKAAEEVVEGFRKEQPNAEFAFVKLDVTNEASWKEAIDFTVKTFGGLTTLVNNAGLSSKPMPMEECTLAEWETLHKVNTTGPFLGCKAASEELKKAGKSGSVVNICSIFAIMGGWGNMPHYHSSKGGVHSFTKNLALAWAPFGIRCNAVYPGVVNTPMVEKVTGSTEGAKALLEGFAPQVPLGRNAEAIDIAKAVAFLASADASFCVGTEIVVDGGYLLK